MICFITFVDLSARHCEKLLAKFNRIGGTMEHELKEAKAKI